MEQNALVAVSHKVQPSDRAGHYGHHGGVLWLTGLSGSGKSTLSMLLEEALIERGYSCYVLDGDNVRLGLNANLGFSPQDRTENIRRVGEVAALFADAGLICIAAFISPYRTDRAAARRACRAAFHEVHVAADLATCESRDPKGFYRKARAGQLPDFTGVGAPYECPEAPEYMVDTASQSEEESLVHLLEYVLGAFPKRSRPSRHDATASAQREGADRLAPLRS